jgi:hypothetical protein
LLDIGDNWNTLSYTAIQSNSRKLGDMSMGDMAGEYTGHGRTGTFSASGNCVQIIIMRKHEVLVVDEWHDRSH